MHAVAAEKGIAWEANVRVAESVTGDAFSFRFSVFSFQ